MGLIRRITILRKTADFKKDNVQVPRKYKSVRGDYRLSMGLYRTPEETEKYIQKSLKRKLP